MEKKTLVEKFEEVKAILKGIDGADEQVAFIQNEIDKLEKAAAKAKERRVEKAAEPDEFYDTVKAALTDEYQTAAQIAAQIATEELTKNKIVARLKKIVDAGEAVSEDVKPEGAKAKAKGYKLA